MFERDTLPKRLRDAEGWSFLVFALKRNALSKSPSSEDVGPIQGPSERQASRDRLGGEGWHLRFAARFFLGSDRNWSLVNPLELRESNEILVEANGI